MEMSRDERMISSKVRNKLWNDQKIEGNRKVAAKKSRYHMNRTIENGFERMCYALENEKKELKRIKG